MCDESKRWPCVLCGQHVAITSWWPCSECEQVELEPVEPNEQDWPVDAPGGLAGQFGDFDAPEGVGGSPAAPGGPVAPNLDAYERELERRGGCDDEREER